MEEQIKVRRVTEFWKQIYGIILIGLVIELLAPEQLKCFDTKKIIRNEKIIISLLADSGYNNVACYITDTKVIITYENIIFRDETTALYKVLDLITPEISSNRQLIIIIQKQKTPLVLVTAKIKKSENKLINQTDRQNTFQLLSVSFDTEKYWKLLKNEIFHNSSNFINNIIIHPQFSAVFGNFDDPVKSQTNISPALNTTITQGLSIFTQIILPIQNELEKEGNYIRPGIINLNYFYRLPFNVFTSTNLGYFTNHRYGLDFEILKLFDNGKYFAGAQFGYTGYSSIYDGDLYYTSVNTFTPSVNVGYRCCNPEVIIKFTYGTNLESNTGWRADINRFFDEFELGFYYTKIDSHVNAGFNFAIPLFPSGYFTNGIIRIRPTKKFRWEYQFRIYSKSPIEYRTNESLLNKILPVYPSHITNALKN